TCGHPHADMPLLDTEALLRILPGMVYRCRHDENRTLLHASASTGKLTGYDIEDILPGGRLGFPDLIHAEDRVHVSSALSAALASGRHYRMSYRIIRADGVQKWVWDEGTAVYDPTEKAMVLEGYLCDATQAT